MALIWPNASAIPCKSAPVAPATLASLFVVSTNSSVSKPNAFSLLVCSINSLLVNGVTAPKACISFIISFVFERLPVKTSKLFLCVSSSAVCTNINLVAAIAANAFNKGAIDLVNVRTPPAADLAALPLFLKDLLDLSNLFFNLSVLLASVFVILSVCCKGLIALWASTINLTVDCATN